jgi:hypothetical protein
VRKVFLFIKQTFQSPELINSAMAGLNGGKKLSGEALSPGSRPRLIALLKSLPAWQEQNHTRVAIRSACGRGKKCFSSVATRLPASPELAKAGGAFSKVRNGPQGRGYIIQPFLWTRDVTLSIVGC